MTALDGWSLCMLSGPFIMSVCVPIGVSDLYPLHAPKIVALTGMAAQSHYVGANLM